MTRGRNALTATTSDNRRRQQTVVPVEAPPPPTAAQLPDTLDEHRTADLPLALWPVAQTTSQYQRRGRYLAESARHPGKMVPELARRAIAAYSQPGDLVLDPMAGVGTTLVEAIHLGRTALGVELEPRWAALASANVALAREQGASGRAGVIEGDARELPRLLARKGRRLLRPPADGVARHPAGSVDLILTSPPYACEVGETNKKLWGQGRNLCPTETRNYSTDRANLGHARGDAYREAMAAVYVACAAVLKPGGYLIAVTKDLREGGGLRDLAGDTIALCRVAGLQYRQHVIALLAAIRDGALLPRPSFWQLTQTRKAVADAESGRPRRARRARLPRGRARLLQTTNLHEFPRTQGSSAGTRRRTMSRSEERGRDPSGAATRAAPPLTLTLPDQALEEIAQRAAVLALARLDPEREPISPWLDAKGAMAYLGFTRDRLYKLTSSGAIPHRKRRGGRRLLFHRAELDQWVEQSYAREGRD